MSPAAAEKAFDAIRMVRRSTKPRTRGLTYARDPGLGIKGTQAWLENYAEYLDILKLPGFAPRLTDKATMQAKIKLCHDYDVKVGLGGALLEHALLQGGDTVERFLDQVEAMNISHIEVCTQIVIAPLADMLDLLKFVERRGIKTIAEVGVAYGITEDENVAVDEARLLSTMRAYRDAGASMLLLESEGLTESRRSGEYRWDIASKVAASFDPSITMFEADEEAVYTHYIKNFGPEVNLFVDLTRVFKLEAARLGGWGKHPLINRVATFMRDPQAK
jgi:phosphosulfolactate synthase (CoM biosynthesis protein A)